LLRIVVVTIRHLQSMILGSGLPDRLIFVAGDPAHIQLYRSAE